MGRTESWVPGSWNLAAGLEDAESAADVAVEVLSSPATEAVVVDAPVEAAAADAVLSVATALLSMEDTPPPETAPAVVEAVAEDAVLVAAAVSVDPEERAVPATMLVPSTLIAPPPDDPVVVATADDAVAEADPDAEEPAAEVEEVALSALELFELSAEEVLDESDAVLVAEAEELSVDDDAAAEELELEPSLPEALFPAIETVHDLVSRTKGSPFFPVMGSRVIVHVWIIGPTEVCRMLVTWTVVDCDKLSPSRASRKYEDCSVRFAGVAGAAAAGLAKSRKRWRRATTADFDPSILETGIAGQ